jgi:malate dehydrogenase (oxaloacetate-decarboxylating)
MEHGRIEVRPTVRIDDDDDLARAYTPGVADACRAIAEDPSAARHLTTQGNSVAVISDGSAVLGLGDVGPRAALPVLEGKAALFRRFAGIDAWPLCVEAGSVADVIGAVRAVAAGFGGINLEDIAAPQCFEVESRLRGELEIPVFHDDQHGTAIVVLAALLNALRVVGKRLSDIRAVVSGAGAAGFATVRLLQEAGARDIAVYDSQGPLHPGRDGLTGHKRWLAAHTQPPAAGTPLGKALAGADTFIGVSGPGILSEDDIAAMAGEAIVFALANPDPEIDPAVASRHAAVVATGRSDHPNQINNVLAFPGVFRGLLDARAREVTVAAQLAAAHAIAGTVDEDMLGTGHIVPSVFDERLVPAVAEAVRQETRGS